jgi:nitroimidazol reductase NimA-like FMN-containing flavoprotein (pyridoxamine 5'-phosphate oxidase superfamily)
MIEATLSELTLVSRELGPECLSTNECVAYLRLGGLGRVGVVAAGLAVVLPVNFVYRDGFIEFRTSTGVKLQAVLTESVLSFEIDHHDPSAGQGWSVLVFGVATATTNSAELAAATRAGLNPQAPGLHDFLVKLRPFTVTGRRFGHPDDLHRLHLGML